MEVKKLFEDYLDDLDTFFEILEQYYKVKLVPRQSVIIFDEVQQYPPARQLIKYLVADGRYDYIETGSLVSLKTNIDDILIPSEEERLSLNPMDFEEFLWANGYGKEAIDDVYLHYQKNESLSEEQHNYLLDLFIRYLLVGGLPDVVNEYLASHNIVNVRTIQNAIAQMYESDASQYEENASRKLLVRRIYSMVVSQMENKKKRIQVQDIQDKKGDRFVRYVDEFEYLISSAISLGVNAIANPCFPLSESLHKNLLKLYLNDVGLLTAKLFDKNIQPVLQYQRSINLGAVYESVVAQELVAHGYQLFYYDNRQKGEVDFIVDDYEHGSLLPIEVKSGRDYTIHSALSNMLNNPDYGICRGIVFSNERNVNVDNKVLYMPIYYVMFLDRDKVVLDSAEYIF